MEFYKNVKYIWLSIFAIFVICLILLARTFYSDANLKLDYVGIIVGVLAILVTILIGWNISNLLQWKDVIDELPKKVNNIEYNTTNAQKYAEALFMNTQYGILFNQKRYVEAIVQIIKTIDKYSQISPDYKQKEIHDSIKICIINWYNCLLFGNGFSKNDNIEICDDILVYNSILTILNENRPIIMDHKINDDILNLKKTMENILYAKKEKKTDDYIGNIIKEIKKSLSCYNV